MESKPCITSRRVIANALPLMAALLLTIGSGPATAAEIITVTIAPDHIEQGSIARIILTGTVPAAAAAFSWNDVRAPLFAADNGTAFSGFLPVDLNASPGKQTLTVTLATADGKKHSADTAFHVVKKKFPTQYLTVDESKVTLSKKDLQRHQREKALITKMFASSRDRRLWGSSFMPPLEGEISTPFGVKRFMNKQPKNPHSGIDIAADTGTPVRAAGAGIVALTGNHFFAGNSVFIDHGQNIITMYFHLDSIAVKDGQQVAAGDIIGRVGATGRVTGPHLHWGLKMYGQRVDPFRLLALFDNYKLSE